MPEKNGCGLRSRAGIVAGRRKLWKNGEKKYNLGGGGRGREGKKKRRRLTELNEKQKITFGSQGVGRKKKPNKGIPQAQISD